MSYFYPQTTVTACMKTLDSTPSFRRDLPPDPGPKTRHSNPGDGACRDFLSKKGLQLYNPH
jgi:hypothetical protein